MAVNRNRKMHTILSAIEWANEKHKGQTRKGSGQPYISHPVAVSYIVAAYKKSKNIQDLIIAAIAHDCLEDTNATFIEIVEKFGPFVASLVLELTNDHEQIEKIGKLEYHKAKLCGISSYALVIKLADRLHNISDQPTKKMLEETEQLMQYLSAHRKLSKTQKALVNAIYKEIDNHDD